MQNTAYAQNHPTGKMKAAKVTAWIHPLVKAELERKAEQQGLSVSKVIAAYLEQAIRQDIHTQHDALLKPMLRQIMREELRTFSNRIVFFLMRIAFAGEQSRILITNTLDRILRREGVPEDKFSSLVDQSSKMARRNIIQKTPQIKTLLEEWESSLGDGGEGKEKRYG